MSIEYTPASARRVVLLETDERSGLVAAIAATCARRAVSLEIATGLAHVLLTFATDDFTLDALVAELGEVSGVTQVRPYPVLAPDKY